GSGAGLILTNLEGVKFSYAMRFRFEATNNEAEYEALIAGIRIAEQMGVKNLQANVDSRLVANQVNGSYIAKESGMVQYLKKVKTLASTFKEFSIRQLPRSENKKADALSKIAYTSFAHLRNPSGKQKRKPGWYVARHLGTPLSMKLYTRNLYLDRGSGASDHFKQTTSLEKYTKDPVACTPFVLPGEIVSDNGKQFCDNPFKDWCEKLCIRQCFASMKHPQANGLVKRANKSLEEGIKA
ncbi:reverse transcriptase domain-containing protein, partial [Tanacetum coccineum]